jgi:general secretion pathway protein I
VIGAAIATPRKSAAFTLLEVMVAIAILALSLTAIFSSEAGAIKMAARSRKIGLATLLVRCKMGEIEEDIANKGLPALFASGSDTCCKENDIEGFNCDWEIEPIILPDNMFINQNPGETPGKPGSSASTGSTQGAAPQGSALSAALGAATTAATGATQGAAQSPLDMVKNLDPATLLSGGGVGGLASLAMSYVYPILKPSFEAQIRRATVTVRWKEGSVPHMFDVTQYVVAEQAPALAVDPVTGQPLPGAQPGQGLPGQPVPGQPLPITGAAPGLPFGQVRP